MKGVGSIIALYIIVGIILAVYIILRISVTVSYYANSQTDEIKLSVKWLCFKIYPRPYKKIKKNKINKNKESKKSKKSKREFKENINEIEEEFVEISEDDLDDKIKSLEKEIERQEQNVKQTNEIPKTDNKSYSDGIDKELNIKQKNKHIKKSQKDNKNNSRLKSKTNNIRQRWKRYKDFIPMTWKYFKKLLKQIRFYDTEIEITSGKDDAYEAAMQYGRINMALFHGLGIVGTVFSLYKPKRAEVKCVFDKKVFEYEISGIVKCRPSTILGIIILFGIKFLYLFLKKRHKAKKQLKLKRKLMLNNKELSVNEG